MGGSLTQNLPGRELGRYCWMSEHTHEVPGNTAGAMRPDSPPATAHAADVETPRSAADGSSRHSEARWSEAIAAYHDGATAPAVAKRFGVTASALYLRVRGDGKRARKRALTSIDDEINDDEINDGVSADPAARATDDALIDSNSDVSSRTRDALRSTVSHATLIEVLLAIGQGLQQLATTAMKIAGAAQARVTREGLPMKRRKFAPAIWQAARRDYEDGDFTAGEIAERYGMVVKTIETRASREGWSKEVTEAPPPLLPHPDPAQVDAHGDSKWTAMAHPAQLAPAGQWSTWLFQGGRGAGKTRAGAEWIASLAEATPNGAFAIVAATEHDLREVMIEGPAGLHFLPGREHPKYSATRRRLHWKNGAVVYGFSAEQPERLRGPQFMAAWADEFCTWKKPHEVLSNLRLGLRLGNDPRLLITTTPKPIKALRKLREESSCVMTQAGTSANAGNLAPTFINGLHALYGGTRLAEQELNGVLVEDEGGLFRLEDFAATRCDAPPGGVGPGAPAEAGGREALDLVVVAIDPPAGLDGSACGIIVAGRGRRPSADGKGRRERVGYVLADYSCIGAKPLEWAKAALRAVTDFGAAKIVAEANQGGEMVRQTLLSAGVTCPIELVHASKGKCVRAEPVSVLYQRGLVRHCGHFRELESQLLAMGVEAAEEQGNDRADALVWAVCALKLITNRAAAPGIRRL